MKPAALHIICLDAPSPPNYGGAIDMYYKIRALALAGTRIILHYFAYREGRDAGELAALCSEVHVYQRGSFTQALVRNRPYTVASRVAPALIRRLNEDAFPILVEGLHCSGVLSRVNRGWERAFVRMHHEEVEYYSRLADAETTWWKRWFFRREAKALRRYMKRIPKDVRLMTLSLLDSGAFERLGFREVSFLPCFIPWQAVESDLGKGDYCLYHGNLSVAENEAAALWLIENVFAKMDLSLTIAGSGLSPTLEAAAKPYPHVRLVANPSMDELDALIREAQIHVLPSLNATGVKLKLLHALLAGRYCMTNQQGVAGSGLEELVIVCEDPKEWIDSIQTFMERPFEVQDQALRRKVLSVYDNQKNAGTLRRWLALE